MKRLLSISLFLVSSLLAACGGGGGGGNPIPTPTPKPAGHVAFSSRSMTAMSYRRRSGNKTQGSCGGASAPIVVQALTGTFAPQPGQNWQAYGNQVTATELNAACQSETDNPTWTQDNQDVSTTMTEINGTAVPTPPPNGVNAFGTTPGVTTLTATFSDGTTGTIAVNSYAYLAVSCGGNWYQGGLGWNAQNGYVSQLDGMCGEVNVTNPQPADAYGDGNGNIIFPSGYDVVEQGNTLDTTTFANIATCSEFASQGTTLTPSSMQGDFILLFQTASGNCVKFISMGSGGTGNNAALVGLYAVSASGNFSF